MFIINILHTNNSRNINMDIHNKRILSYIKEKRVVTSSEVAEYLKVSWNTADKYLMELVIEGKIERIKKLGVNLWVLKK